MLLALELLVLDLLELIVAGLRVYVLYRLDAAEPERLLEVDLKLLEFLYVELLLLLLVVP